MKKYKDDIVNFLLFSIIIFAIIINRELNNLDEIWIFNMARNIANGLLPYRDFSLIITPGLPILCGGILKLFGTEMFVMRIISIIVDTVIIFMVYKTLKVLDVDKYLSTGIALFMLNLFIGCFCIDYNFMILMIALINLYLELKHYNKTQDIFEYNAKMELLLGILAGICITIKQTTGICLAVMFIGYKLLCVRSKNEFKKFIKIAMTRLFAVLIPVVLLILYLLCNSIMKDFIDYAILGISDFSNSKPYTNLLKGELWYLAILVPITIISSFIMLIKRRDNILTILFAYSISTIIVVYPIADTIHFLIAGTIGMITGVYMLAKLCKDKVKGKMEKKDLIWIESFIKAIVIIVATIIFLASIYSTINVLRKLDEYKTLGNFKYIPVSESLKEKILKMGEYIEEREEDVYILDSSAALYMIPLNRYNKNYDMFMKGNFGAKGSNGLIEDLKTKEDAVILILNDRYSMNWQTPEDVIKYIKNNYRKIGEIETFDIYEK